jgi:UDP-N-acetylmuramyl pentapeptide phosphotransferase/UDP-N-acetylglucosamine-1-phosphate transferase
MTTVGDLTIFFGSSLSASVCLLWLLQPLWRHYALAPPNVRSSHKVPTPQGGGIVIIAVTVSIVSLAIALMPTLHDEKWNLALLLVAALSLAVVGAIDDVHVLEAIPRLLLQAAAVTIVITALPTDLRIVPALPWPIERAALLVGGLWFVNLVNFMDGVDWMTVCEVVPMTAALALFGLIGLLPTGATLVAITLCGAMVGFAPFNRPVARLFLGDVGSLPIGLLVGWLLVLLANRHLTAALLLPLYYVADATLTLLKRLVRGDPVMQAHRSHFYQCALDHGRNTYQIVGRVFLVNVALTGLAALTVLKASPALHLVSFAAGSCIVGALLWNFSQKQEG